MERRENKSQGDIKETGWDEEGKDRRGKKMGKKWSREGNVGADRLSGVVIKRTARN